MDPVQLRDNIRDHFNRDELDDLCFTYLAKYGVRYDDLPGDGLGAQARALVELCERRNLLPQLVDACKRARPEVSWEDPTPAQPTPPPPPAPDTAPAAPDASAPVGPPTGSTAPPPTPGAPPTPPGPPAAAAPADPLDPHFTVLISRILAGRLAPFLGADVNLLGRPQAAGWSKGQYFPSSAEMATYLFGRLQALGYPPTEEGDLASITEHATLTLGVGSLYEEMRNLLDADYPPTALHTLLAGLPALLRDRGYPPVYQVILTSNFDDMLERAFQAQNEPYDVLLYMARDDSRDIARDQFVHQPYGGEPQAIEKPNEYNALPLNGRTIIVKIYGALNRRAPDGENDSYVITEDDFIGYMSRIDITGLLPAPLISQVRKSNFLFLGSNLRDWNRRVVFQRLWDEPTFKKFRSWAVPLNKNVSDSWFWQQRDIELVADVSLQEYVDRLARRLANLPAAGAKP
ncbi:MAG: SIR2 family protein [Anaerolineae bacterium]